MPKYNQHRCSKERQAFIRISFFWCAHSLMRRGGRKRRRTHSPDSAFSSDSETECTNSNAQNPQNQKNPQDEHSKNSHNLQVGAKTEMQLLIDALQDGTIALKNRSSAILIKKLKHIDEMIGLEKLKVFVTEVFYYHAAQVPCDSMFPNICITGVPGSGKTEVCLRIASLLQYILFSTTCAVPVLGRADLVGRVLGETAIKTKQCLAKHRQKCVFIDEVYSLGNGNSDHDSFSKEAVDTICGFLSEHVATCAMVIAGYQNETNECFFSINPGLERRFPWRFTLEKYAASELLDIFLYKLPKFQFEDVSLVYNFFVSSKSFGAADVISFINKVLLVHCRAVCMNGCPRKKISSATLKSAITKVHVNQPERLDSHMYM